MIDIPTILTQLGLNITDILNLGSQISFNLVSTETPVVMFACNHALDRDEKDTIAIVSATCEFVV